MSESNSRRKRLEEWRVSPVGLFFAYSAPMLVALFAGILVVAVFWPFIFVMLWSKFQTVQDKVWVRCVVVLVLIGMASCLYFIRQYARQLYGAIEVVVGTVACWIILRNTQAERMTVTIALVGSVYVIVRGIDNYIEGRKHKSSNQRFNS